MTHNIPAAPVAKANATISEGLRKMPDADLLELHSATFRELRHREQIAGYNWSRSDMDAHFDRLCKDYDAATMEAHRTNFRKFALRSIAGFIAHDAQFENRVKRELRRWMNDHVNKVPTAAMKDDSRVFWESLSRPADDHS